MASPETFTFHGAYRPPVVIAPRVEQFICVVCGRPGYGPPNALVHPGPCREARTKSNSIAAAARRRKKAHKSC